MEKQMLVWEAALLLAILAAGVLAAVSIAPGAVAAAAAALIFALRCGFCRREALRAQAFELASLERRIAEERALAAQRAEALTSEHKAAIVGAHSTISHSLRIPISIVLGYAELLGGELVTDEAVRKEYLDKICERVRYMSDLLGQMLTEARADGDGTSALTEPLDVLRMIREVADEVAAAAAKKNIIIRVNSVEERVMVDGDALQMTKIFYNILENALKYMGREGTVNIMVASAAENEALIVFKDDGVGLDAREAERIFELNYQGSNRTSGNGHGLHLVREGILAHGGSIEAKSGIGKGMGIYIRLPIWRGDA